MDLRQLRYFVAVAEERNFGRAAERLHMAQPPLSQQIRRMEAELGAPLFVRTTRSVELAPAGEVLLERARGILAEVDHAMSDARRAARGELGRLSIGFTGSATYALMPAVASAIRRTLPGIELALQGEMLTPAQVSGLLQGSLDLAILRPPVVDRRLVVEVVRSEPLIAVVPARHRLAAVDAVAVADLAPEPFVAYPSHYRSVLHDAVERICAAHGFEPVVAVEVAETATLVSFVAAGLGVSLVPRSVAQMTVAGAVYRELRDSDASVELALSWRCADASPALAAALRLVRSEMAEVVPPAR